MVSFFGFGAKDNWQQTRLSVYLSGVVSILFDDTVELIYGKFDRTEFPEKWYVIVPFILLIIRIVHFDTDKKSQNAIDKEIERYFYDSKNPVNYLNKFNYAFPGTLNYDKSKLASKVIGLFKDYESMLDVSGGNPEIISSNLNSTLSDFIEKDEELIQNKDVTKFLINYFQDGRIKLFKA